MTYVVIGGLALAALIQIRVEWLNRHDRCEPHADHCTKHTTGHQRRHHGPVPVPYHATCPRR